jgi:hypothetical protein
MIDNFYLARLVLEIFYLLYFKIMNLHDLKVGFY